MTDESADAGSVQEFGWRELATQCYRMPMPFPERLTLVRCPACGAREYGVAAYELIFRVVRCADCGHFYVNPVPDAEYISAYNKAGIGEALDYQATWLESRSPAAQWIARWCRRRYPRGGSVLDIGTGFGDLLSFFDSHLWRRAGIELSPEVAAQANRLLGEGTVRVGDAATTGLPSGHYDVVCLINVIEHLIDPHSVLVSVRQSLKPSSVLLVRWPQILFLYTLQAIMGQHYPGIQAPCHLHDFRRRSVERLLARCGYGIVRHYVVNNMDSLKRRHLALSLAMRSIDWSSRLANRIALGRRCVPWGSVVTVARPLSAGSVPGAPRTTEGA